MLLTWTTWFSGKFRHHAGAKVSHHTALAGLSTKIAESGRAKSPARLSNMPSLAYLAFGIPCVWLIHPETRRAWIHNEEGSREKSSIRSWIMAARSSGESGAGRH